MRARRSSAVIGFARSRIDVSAAMLGGSGPAASPPPRHAAPTPRDDGQAGGRAGEREERASGKHQGLLLIGGRAAEPFEESRTAARAPPGRRPRSRIPNRHPPLSGRRAHVTRSRTRPARRAGRPGVSRRFRRGTPRGCAIGGRASLRQTSRCRTDRSARSSHPARRPARRQTAMDRRTRSICQRRVRVGGMTQRAWMFSAVFV